MSVPTEVCGVYSLSVTASLCQYLLRFVVCTSCQSLPVYVSTYLGLWYVLVVSHCQFMSVPTEVCGVY